MADEKDPDEKSPASKPGAAPADANAEKAGEGEKADEKKADEKKTADEKADDKKADDKKADDEKADDEKADDKKAAVAKSATAEDKDAREKKDEKGEKASDKKAAAEAKPSKKDEAKADGDGDEPKPKDDKPKSPWPSSRKPDPAEPAAAKSAAQSEPPHPSEEEGKAAWGRPIDRFEKAWSKLEARLCAGVLIAEILTMFFWISMKALSLSGKGGPGMIYRMLVTAVVLGVVAHRLSKKHAYHQAITTVAAFAGLVLGRFYGDHGTTYFANWLAWMQNASILVFFGGVSEIAKRFTLWLALLGASLATAQGKHINVDVVMRFLTPKARVPVAVLGWMVAAVVSLTGAWGFFDSVAVEEYRAPTTVPCPGDESKSCPASWQTRVGKVTHDTTRNLFLAGRQVSLDLRTFPKVLTGTPYGKSMTPREWNAWLKDSGWESHFKAEDVKALELPEDGTMEFRNPAVTAIPGGTEAIPKIMVPLLNFVFAFGLLAIAIRFVLRSLLAISGWVKVDPNAAHGDEELAHAHDHSAQADAVEERIKETLG